MFKQTLIPGFPEGAEKIGDVLSILEKEGTVTYFLGGDNYFSHPKGDKKSQRYVLANLMVNGHVRARDLEEAPWFIPHRTLMNWVAQYRKDGSTSFFRTADPAKPRVMTLDKSAECAHLLAEGLRPVEVAKQAGIKESTLRKALKRNAVPRLPEGSREGPQRKPAAAKVNGAVLTRKRLKGWVPPVREPMNESPPPWAWPPARRRALKRVRISRWRDSWPVCRRCALMGCSAGWASF